MKIAIEFYHSFRLISSFSEKISIKNHQKPKNKGDNKAGVDSSTPTSTDATTYVIRVGVCSSQWRGGRSSTPSPFNAPKTISWMGHLPADAGWEGEVPVRVEGDVLGEEWGEGRGVGGHRGRRGPRLEAVASEVAVGEEGARQ